MPTYEYRCRDCQEQLEVVQSIHDPALTQCPSCGGQLRKLFGNVGVVFKGSGFYRTDNRAKSKAGSGAEPRKAEVKPDSGKSDSGKSEPGKSGSSAAETGKSEKPGGPSSGAPSTKAGATGSAGSSGSSPSAGAA